MENEYDLELYLLWQLKFLISVLKSHTLFIESEVQASNDAVGAEGAMETEEFPTWSKDCKTPDRHLSMEITIRFTF